MERLSGIEAVSLHTETSRTPMHRSAISAVRSSYRVVSHETAHLWLDDLATMKL